MKRIRLLALFLVILAAFSLRADDFDLWTTAGVEKKIDKKSSAEIEGEIRMADKMKRVSRWSLAASADYKVAKWMKFDGGYKFIMNHNAEEIEVDEEGDYLKYTPSLWTSRHRVHLSATGSLSVGIIKISLRERWQYTYQPEVAYGKFDYTTQKWKVKSGRGENVSRTRLRAEWSPKKKPQSISVDAEFFVAHGLQKIRYTASFDYKLTKRHSIGLFYRYIDHRGDDEDDLINSHIVGLGYKFKF